MAASIEGETVKEVRRILTDQRGGPWRPNRRAVAQADLAAELERSRTWVVRLERKGGDNLVRLALVGLLVLEGADLAELVERAPELVPERAYQ